MSDSKNAKASIASIKMDKIILESYLTNAMPTANKFCLKQMYKYTGYRYYNLRNYIYSDLYTISKHSIDITDNTQLLSDKSKKYVECLIKTIVKPIKYQNNRVVYLVGKLFDNSYFTEEEQKFIELMTNELFLIINRDEISCGISTKDLFDFHNLNHPPFLYTARKVYNDILHKRIRAGDSIMQYINTHLENIQVVETLEKSGKYDYFFDSKGVLKCDLVTNINILIKNFLSTVFYDLEDSVSKTILLLKLNSKYPFMTNRKIFYGFN